MNREERFCRTYQATIQPGCRQYHRVQRHHQGFVGESTDPIMTAEVIRGVEINMPEDRFCAFLEMEERLRELMDPSKFVDKHPADRIWDEHVKECKIRNECPSVQIAYEKYQNLLHLVSSGYD